MASSVSTPRGGASAISFTSALKKKPTGKVYIVGLDGSDVCSAAKHKQ